MSAFREAQSQQASFPFSVHVREHRERMNIRLHYHDWYEIVLINEGTGQFFIDPCFLEFREGDMFLIPGNLIHSGFAPHSTYTLSCVKFSPSLIHQLTLGDEVFYLEPFEQSKNQCIYRFSLPPKHKIKIEQWLENMHQEIKNRFPGYRHAVLAILHQMLIELLRIGKQHYPEQPHKVSRSEAWMKEILEYIHHHLNERLSLDSLAGQALVSTAHFSRVFKQMTGFHLPDYLKTKRILQAKDLLLNSEESTAQIAEQCGFQSLSHFHRTFRANFGMAPGAFRMLHQSVRQVRLPKTDLTAVTSFNENDP